MAIGRTRPNRVPPHASGDRQRSSAVVVGGVRGPARLSPPMGALLSGRFGSTQGELSPSIWDLREIGEWANLHKLWRTALNQCEFGATYGRPTGLLTSIPLLDERLYRGWPILRQRPDGTAEYTGPLWKTCHCKQSHSLPQLRLHGTPWEPESVQSWLTLVLRRCLDRELLPGEGLWSTVAMQGLDSKQSSNQFVLDSDSDITVPEPTSPRSQHSRLASRRAGTCLFAKR